MIGIPTGAAAGFFVVDIDAPKQVTRGPIGQLTPDGREAWEALKEENGGHESTIEVLTPGGGRHVWFKDNPSRPTSNKEGAFAGLGIDVRGNGGYVIVPPSRNAAGVPYRYANGHVDDPTPAPEWIHKLIGARRTARTHSNKLSGDSISSGGILPNTGATIESFTETPSTFPHTPENESLLRGALLAIPADDRELWLRILMSLHSIRSEWSTAREIADWWSKRSTKFDPVDQSKTWECFTADRDDRITIGTLFYEARARGWVDPRRGNGATTGLPGTASPATLDDFVAYLPQHHYIYRPTRELWPSVSVNSVVAPVPSSTGKPTPASTWLDVASPVQQMSWAPGEPELIHGRLVSDGGWVERQGVTCYNLYRPPSIVHGDASKANRWLDHIYRLFPDDAAHITRWLAHRVQRPGEKINHALVLGSADQGTGKDTLIAPVKHSVGPWNFSEPTPMQIMARFNGFVKSVIMRVSEARDLGDVTRYEFYDRMKAYCASPPDVLRCDEKNLREHSVLNCCGVVLTTNYKCNGLYLPPEDRRHYVAWTERTQADFNERYWNGLWAWYDGGGFGHVAAYLAEYDIFGFDPKAPPPKTAAFWDIVDANRAPEDAELADVLDTLGNPEAVTIEMIAAMVIFMTG